MKIQIPAAQFADAAAWAGKAINQKPNVPVMSGLLVEAAQDQIRLSGFDYDVSARATTGAEVLDAGNVLLPGRMVIDIVRKLGNRPLEIVVEGRRATVSAGKTRFNLSTLPTDDYPKLPDLPPSIGTVDGAMFAEAVTDVATAVSVDTSIPVLTGIYVTTEGDQLNIMGTDKYRIITRTIQWEPVDPDVVHSFLVKGKWLTDAAKNAAGEVSILADPDGSIVGLRTGNRASTSGQIDGDYPKVEKLFPSETTTNVTVDTESLKDSVDRIGLVAERTTPVRLTITDDGIELDAGTGEDAQGSDTIDCELDGPEIMAAFNPGYLSSVLSTIHSDTVQLGFNTAAKPVLFTTEDDPDGKSLIMPIRLPGKD